MAARAVAAVVAVVVVMACAGAGAVVWLRPDWLAGAFADGRAASAGTGASSRTSAGGGTTHRTLGRAAAPQPSAKASKQRDMDALGQAIRSRIAGYQGTWQVYVEDLASGASVSVDSHPSYAASDIKLYVMLAVFQRIADGAVSDDASLDQLLTQMITVSSNEATNSLVTMLGGGDMQAGFTVVNDTAARYGFKDSRISQALGVTPVDANGKVTTADDCGRFMAAAYRGRLVSGDASRRMIDLLLGQTRRAKIPGGVPAGVTVANKTGENTGVENDAALVFAGSDTSGAIDGSATQGDYAIAVMTSDVASPSAAQASIRDLSAAVWDALR